MSSRRRRRPVPRKSAAPKKPTKPVAPAASEPAAPPRSDAPKAPYIGRLIGRCRIEERIGLGKTAAVYRAHYEALDDYVAVKILTPDASSMPRLVERFQSEAKVVAQLDNENVVKVYDVGSDGDAHFMVMELLDGYSVLDLIQREGKVEPMDALRVVRQAANGLAAAHDRNIIHRDVKPQNLLLLEDGTVKVLDFGLAAGFDDDSGERVGTPHYMAPEVCEDGSADLGTDMYGLGIVLYHLLVGQPPYAGKDIRGIMRAHIECKPLRPEHETPRLPKEVTELVRSLTKRDPLTRPTATAVVQTIDAIGGEEIQEKDSLGRRRSARNRSRAEARKKSPVVPALIAVAVVGILLAVMAGGGNDDPKRGTEPEPRAEDPASVSVNNPPVVPTESEALRLAREKREREADEAKEQARLEKDGQRSLLAVETWARTHWDGPEDTKAVIDKYQSVYSRFKKTPAATEALRRLKGIRKNEIHPHPDRSWSDEQSVSEVRAEWRTLKPEIDALVARHHYTAAWQKLPKHISDKDGQLSEEIDSWRTLLEHLRHFQSALPKAVESLDADARQIETPDGAGEARVVKTFSMNVRVGNALKEYDWGQLDAAQILALARTAFSEKDTKYFVYALAFAFAHRLQDEFWDLQLDLSGKPDVSNFQQAISGYESKFDARISGG